MRDHDDIREVEPIGPGRPRTPGRPIAVRVFGVIFALIATFFAFTVVTTGGPGGGPPFPFIAIAMLVCGTFVAVGFMMAFGRGSRSGRSGTSNEVDASVQLGYTCPSCGAALGKGADVSPHGDVRCSYCERWFNVHGREH